MNLVETDSFGPLRFLQANAYFFPVVLLVVSAVLKTHVLLAAPASELLIGGSFVVTLFVTWLELFLAAWLASRFQPRLSVWVGMVVFSIFGLVSFLKVLQGSTNCGCFGAFETSPWLSLTIDLVAIFCLNLNRLRSEAEESKPASRRRVSCVWWCALTICLLQIGLIMRFSPFLKSDEIAFDGISGIAFLEPSKWIGKKFPLTPFVENGSQLDEGKWTIFLLVSQCELCHAVLDSVPSSPKETRIAVLEIPPFSDDKHDSKSSAVFFRLDAERKWYATAPVKLEVQNGVVLSVTTRDEIKRSLGK